MRQTATIILAATLGVGATSGFHAGQGAQTAPAASASEFDARAVDAERTRLQTRLLAAIDAFDAGFGSDAAARDGWHAHLNWDAWAPALQQDQSWTTDGMKPIVKRLYDAKDGFEHPRIVELRSAMTDYITFDEFVRQAHGDLPAEHRRRLEQLRRAAASNPLDYAALEDAAAWLAATRQAPQELAALRTRFNAPVIFMQVHRELVEAKLDKFQRDAHEQRPTRNTIQGATVVGTATIHSHTTAQLVDAGHEARLRVVTTGTVDAPHNTSSTNRVRVASSSKSRFTVTADLYFDGKRFVATTPLAVADTRSTIKHIDAPRLIRRAAARRVNASRPAAEAQGESIIERSVADSMSERLAIAVDKLADKSAGFLSLLDHTGNAAAKWTTGVRPTAVHVGYLPSTQSGLGALPHEMPPLDGDETLGLSIHDAGLESILRPQVAGAVWTDVAFSMLQRELTGENTEEMMIGLEPERWSAQWSWRVPVRIHFTPERATVRYRFARVEIDGAAYDTPFEVRADMRIFAPPLGHELELLAPATVTSLDPQNPLPPHFQAFLERKFRGLFGERFDLDGMQFPAGGALDGMSGFRVAGARLESNWVHLRYTNRQPHGTLVVGEGGARAAP
jgi:hypothetical protein